MAATTRSGGLPDPENAWLRTPGDVPDITLVEFLTARLDEDEQAARAATPGPWHWQWPGEEYTYLAGATIDEEDGDPVRVLDATGEHTNGYVLAADADKLHIARHDPPRVLAEVAAKRRIVALHTPTPTARATYEGRGYRSCLVCEPTPPMDAPNPGACETLRLLALPFADHPDYRDEWRPA